MVSGKVMFLSNLAFKKDFLNSFSVTISSSPLATLDNSLLNFSDNFIRIPLVTPSMISFLRLLPVVKFKSLALGTFLLLGFS